MKTNHTEAIIAATELIQRFGDGVASGSELKAIAISNLAITTLLCSILQELSGIHEILKAPKEKKWE